MAKGAEYRIKKVEKGPLARFKNQNLLIKKYGETGLQIYKAITGKRTTGELQKDLGVDPHLFDQVVAFMQDSGMIELEAVGKEEIEKSAAERFEEEEKPARKLEEIPPEDLGPEVEKPPLEEKPRKKEEKPEEFEFEAPKAKKKKEELEFEEIKPVEFADEYAQSKEGKEEEEARKRKETEREEEEEEEEIQPVKMQEEAGEEKAEEEAPEEENPEEEKPGEEKISGEEEETPEKEKEEEGGISFEEEAPKPEEEEEEALSPVEKIIFGKYGDVGLKVYALIDGQRTAEEIMRETNLTEQKLVEILDFMDEQGIIKLDYPKGGSGPSAPPPSAFAGAQSAQIAEAKKEEGFVPMIEGEESLEEARGVPSPVEMPVRAPMDIVKSVQLKAKLMFKFQNNKGGRVYDLIDGKNDILDISLKLDMPLYEVSDIMRFMMENGMLIMKPLSRSDVRRKYGDDGYSVYKRFGKEGLMLYELIGKELTIRQMADKITKDKAKVIDMFIFIHKVLGIELPIDRDVLAKQLGL